MRYAVASFNRHQEEVGYRHYFTELVRLQGDGKNYGLSLYDLMHPQPTDNRTAEEIAAEVVAMAGLKVKDGPAQPIREDRR